MKIQLKSTSLSYSHYRFPDERVWFVVGLLDMVSWGLTCSPLEDTEDRKDEGLHVPPTSAPHIYMFPSLTTVQHHQGVEYLSPVTRGREHDGSMYSSGMRHVLVLQLTLTLAAASTDSSHPHKLLIAFQAPWNTSFPFSALRLGAAIQIAVEKVNTNPSFLGNYSLDFIYKDTDCNPKVSLGGFIDLAWRENVSALFGPACPEEAEVCTAGVRSANTRNYY